MDDLEKVAKKCGIEGWPLERVSGPRALVLAWGLVEPLRQAGVEDPVHAAQAVAGIYGPPPTYGGYRARLADPPMAAAGAPVSGSMLFVEASADWHPPAPGSHVMIALPAPPWTEDTALLGLPFEAASTVEAPIRIEGTVVSYGAAGDEVRYGTPEEAVDAARHWLDWAQEYGREVFPDRLWIVPKGTHEQVARLIEATLTADGEARFDEVVVAPDGRLLPWSATVDAQGVE